MQREASIKSIMESMRTMRRNMMALKRHKASMTHAQLGILHQISHGEAKTVKELAECFHLSKSAITQHVNVLADKDLITRKENPEDRRHIILEVTPTFRKKSKALHSKMAQHLNKLFAPLSDKELEEFARLHEKVSNHILSNE